jgi:hypothetical protein
MKRKLSLFSVFVVGCALGLYGDSTGEGLASLCGVLLVLCAVVCATREPGSRSLNWE